MHRTTGTDSKSKSKAGRQPPKELRKTRTEKDLHSSVDKPSVKKPAFCRSSSNRDLQSRREQNPYQPVHVQSHKQFEFFRGSLPANKLEPPKWNIQYRSKQQQPSSPQMLHRQRSEQQQIRRIERQILVEKPKIMKQKTESYAQLQHRLRSLQQKLEQLKESMVRGQSKYAKSRSKDRRSQRSEQEKNESIFVQSQALNNYVTQVKPVAKKHYSPPDTLSSKLRVPYYLGHLTKHTRKSKLQCPVYEHILQSLTTINYMKRIVKPTEASIERKKLNLRLSSRNIGRKTIVFDLDETLIHCNEVEAKCDVKLPIVFPNGQRIAAGINIRPYAREVLESLAKSFELVVFTASHSCYANVVIDHIDPTKKLISHRLFREHCFETESGMYIKDLRIIGNRDLSQLVLVDNAAYSYYFQLDNGVPVVPFFNNRKDCELLSLQHFLMKEVLPAGDVRPILRQHFKLHRYCQFSSPSKMIEALYI